MNLPTKNIKPYTEVLMQRVPEGATCPLNLLTNNITPFRQLPKDSCKMAPKGTSRALLVPDEGRRPFGLDF